MSIIQTVVLIKLTLIAVITAPSSTTFHHVFFVLSVNK